MTTIVYALSDQAGDVLYVGCTDHLLRRLTDHQTKPWWQGVRKDNPAAKAFLAKQVRKERDAA